ncbi:hypothetical protein PHLGIDRAFT_127783 [Phlebiopsis gigantea 11061_1 CR5-6]|uniref:Secreted protein n=1 Tax=Phlebiopsis gigantea (strain 11061_1 CR5-6) TaxID=745531 RepID=A0A0C3S8A7_PHLG1|nr:hypothetical protein PHLGIDRAFT_127783 [Phlebiopsis gigantea 11061_1 CR5-6]
MCIARRAAVLLHWSLMPHCTSGAVRHKYGADSRQNPGVTSSLLSPLPICASSSPPSPSPSPSPWPAPPPLSTKPSASPRP